MTGSNPFVPPILARLLIAGFSFAPRLGSRVLELWGGVDRALSGKTVYPNSVLVLRENGMVGMEDDVAECVWKLGGCRAPRRSRAQPRAGQSGTEEGAVP